MDIPINSVKEYIGLALLALGGFMILAGFDVISVQQVTVKKGRRTWAIGIIFALFGILLLLPEYRTLAPTPISPTPVPPTANPTTAPAITPALTITKTPIPTSTADPIGSNFGDPILDTVQGYKPIFEDDFSSDKDWVGTTGSFNDPLTLSLDGGFVQALGDGTRGFAHIAIPYLGELPNFVVKVDAAFMESPVMPRDRAIGLCWEPGDRLGERFLLYESGVYQGATCTPNELCPTFAAGKTDPISTEQLVSLILIHQKGESVVYVNGVPEVYHLLSINNFGNGFSLCPHTFDGLQSNVKYDNVRVWNLDQIPELP